MSTTRDDRTCQRFALKLVMATELSMDAREGILQPEDTTAVTTGTVRL